MTVETTIQRMFNQYPDLFSTRRDCYNHLFCVNGCGYEWRRGQVVACDDKATEDDEERDYATPHRINYINYNGSGRNIENEWYPISRFSLIKNIPENVKPDWKEAIEECKQMLKEDEIEF